MRILMDNDIRELMPMGDAIGVMENAFRDRAQGQMVSPPREGIQTGKAGLVWTPGGLLSTHVLGLRVYLTGVERNEQLVAAWDSQNGSLLGLAIGSYLGKLRTGAIGGLAMASLSQGDAGVVGVVGFGEQAWFQVEAALAVRPITQVVAYRRDRKALETLVERARQAWGVAVVAADSPQEAVQSADIVITATDSSTPVIESSWLKPGAHVNALGPKQVSRSELDPGIAEDVGEIVSDFPEQYLSDPNFLWQGTRHAKRLQDLAGLIAAGWSRTSEAKTLFLSHGLAGTEVRLLQTVLTRAALNGRGVRV